MTYDLGPGDMPSVDMSGDPAPPGIGAQLDRAGRPLINTILTNPFDLTLTGTGADTKARMQDAYNASVDPAGLGHQVRRAAPGSRCAGLLGWHGRDLRQSVHAAYRHAVHDAGQHPGVRCPADRYHQDGVQSLLGTRDRRSHQLRWPSA